MRPSASRRSVPMLTATLNCAIWRSGCTLGARGVATALLNATPAVLTAAGFTNAVLSVYVDNAPADAAYLPELSLVARRALDDWRRATAPNFHRTSSRSNPRIAYRRGFGGVSGSRTRSRSHRATHFSSTW